LEKKSIFPSPSTVWFDKSIHQKFLMTPLLIAFLVLVALLVVVGVILMSTYNRLVVLRNQFHNAFSQIDIQLKRRYDLIPNLVETAKAYMKHERETLEAVIAARNQAATACASAALNPSDSMALGQLSRAEGQLTGVMGRLFAVSEAYPELKANGNMMQLTEELTSTENRVTFARQAYNDAVTSYNNVRDRFPTNIIAGMFSFTKASLFEITAPAERETVRVSF
jgi:LemA protein